MLAHMAQCPQRTEEGIGSLELGSLMIVSLHVVAGNQTQLLPSRTRSAFSAESTPQAHSFLLVWKGLIL